MVWVVVHVSPLFWPYAWRRPRLLGMPLTATKLLNVSFLISQFCDSGVVRTLCPTRQDEQMQASWLQFTPRARRAGITMQGVAVPKEAALAKGERSHGGLSFIYPSLFHVRPASRQTLPNIVRQVAHISLPVALCHRSTRSTYGCRHQKDSIMSPRP